MTHLPSYLALQTQLGFRVFPELSLDPVEDFRLSSVCAHMVGFRGATVNQHPWVHHEGWMINCLETVFCYVPVH